MKAVHDADLELDVSEETIEYAFTNKGVEYTSIVERRDSLIEYHQKIMEGIKALTEEYNTKMQSLNQQQLLILGEVRGLNSLLPQELVRVN